MDIFLRESGIGLIGSVPWGTHMGQLYSSKADLQEMMVPYINSGLNNNELCLWIYCQRFSYGEIRDILREQIDDVDSYIDKGQLIIIPHTEWYLLDNSFDAVRVNRQWNQLIRHTLDRGFDGLRAVADVGWVNKGYYREFLHYEDNINRIISELPFIVVCLYDGTNVDTFEIAGIIKTHSYILTRYEGKIEAIKNVELERAVRVNEELLNDTREYDKMKTEFFSNMSHELRTPLHVILSAIQLMKAQNGLSGQSNENRCLKIMQQNCFRLLRLVNNLIDITKIEAGFFKLTPQNYDIVGLVEEITLSVIEYSRNKGITIFFDTDIEEKIIACDPDQIERIILNLLSNAIKFTPSGGYIWVNVYNCGDYIKISVKDTGIGIPLDKQEYIFNRFQQVDKSLTRQNEGSGIGLSLVKALVEKHDGRITLKSRLGRGSEFIIELPCRTVEYQETYQQTDSGNSNCFIEKINIEFSDIYS